VGTAVATKSKRIAYVTGGMGGIGTAICRRLSRDGITVIAGCGPGSTRKERWLAEMRGAGLEIFASEGNVSDWDSTKRAFEVAVAEVGPIDILVNNAGITRDSTFQKMTNEAWHAVIETNLNSLFHVTKQVLDGMIERGWGRIINISSVNGQKGQFGQTNYSTAKAGIRAGSRRTRGDRQHRLPGLHRHRHGPRHQAGSAREDRERHPGETSRRARGNRLDGSVARGR